MPRAPATAEWIPDGGVSWAWERFEEHAPDPVERRFGVAGLTIAGLFATEEVAEAFWRPFVHLADGGAPDVRLAVWGAEEAGVPFPPLPVTEGDTGPTYFLRRRGEQALAQPITGSITFLGEDGRGMFWARSLAALPSWERASPLRYVLNWWLGAQGLQVIHGAGIGTPDGGVLVAGPGGTGKSTTTLACLDSDLRTVGDDFLLLDTRAAPVAHSVYGSVKLKPDGIGRFPELSPLIDNRSQAPPEKAIVYLAEARPEVMLRALPIRAIVVPRIVAGPGGQVRPISKPRALLVLAPSSIVQLPGTRQDALAEMGALASAVPAFELEIGTDLARIPAAIARLLDDLGPGA